MQNRRSYKRDAATDLLYILLLAISSGSYMLTVACVKNFCCMFSTSWTLGFSKVMFYVCLILFPERIEECV